MVGLFKFYIMSLKTKDPISIGGKTVSLSGKFRLTINRDPRKFYVTNLDGYVPRGQTVDKKVKFLDENGPVGFLLISRIDSFYKPDESDIDAHNVKVLITHPDVRLSDMSDKEHEYLVTQGLKKANPEYTLINLDKAIMDLHEEEQDMVEIKYLILKKNSSLSKKKLMYISSALHLTTRSEITDEKRYIVSLQKQLVQHLSNNVDDRKMFMFYYDKINDAEVLYFIDEMIIMGIIEEFGGMYKLDSKPLGFEIKNIVEYFASQPEEYEQYKLKVQKFHSDNDKVTA